MIISVSKKTLRRRRSLAVLVGLFIAIIFSFKPLFSKPLVVSENQTPSVLSDNTTYGTVLAIDELDKLQVKGRAPKTGYSRSEFGDGWAEIQGCDMRNIILSRSLSEVEIGSDGCVVLNGKLIDPYTAKVINFKRGVDSSADIQIDHVVALSDAWQKGAQNLSFETRIQLANDPLELLAVDGPANQQKGDSDAASWLPPNKSYRCQYVARQIAVKVKYSLWVTEAEKSAMKRVLNSCKEQVLPIEK
ncbi:HNH endonuclease [Candidatus Saccharibacteria bacterium]|nr:HNH endonuclease [Candidatus Saccharibacteria bacterium]